MLTNFSPISCPHCLIAIQRVLFWNLVGIVKGEEHIPKSETWLIQRIVLLMLDFFKFHDRQSEYLCPHSSLFDDNLTSALQILKVFYLYAD